MSSQGARRRNDGVPPEDITQRQQAGRSSRGDGLTPCPCSGKRACAPASNFVWQGAHAVVTYGHGKPSSPRCMILIVRRRVSPARCLHPASVRKIACSAGPGPVNYPGDIVTVSIPFTAFVYYRLLLAAAKSMQLLPGDDGAGYTYPHHPRSSSKTSHACCCRIKASTHHVVGICPV